MPYTAQPIAGYKCLINLAAGPSVGDVDLVLTDAGDHKTFTVPLSSTRRYLDRAVAVVVQTTLDGSTWTTQSAGNYTLRYATAQVVLNSALSGGTSYGLRLHAFSYYPYAPIVQAYDVTGTVTTQMLDSTNFQGASGAGFLSFVPGLTSGQFAAKSWQLTPGGAVYAQHQLSRDLLIFSLFDGNGLNAMESYGYLSDTSWQSSITTLAGTDLTFMCDSLISLI